MSDIFISYRRQDSDAYAGRLYDRLAARFDKARIFMDIDMDLGIDFATEIEQRVGSCKVLVAVIGRGWLDVKDGEGRRRLDDPNDWVRLEIVAALERKIPVIPALVGGAMMPAASDLPDPLSKLTRRQAIEITHSGFHSDADRLIRGLEKILASEPKQTKKTPASSQAADAGGKGGSTQQILERPEPHTNLLSLCFASSTEVSEDADALFSYFSTQDDMIATSGLRLRMVSLEDSLDMLSNEGLRNESIGARHHDFFVGLLSANVAKFAEESFEIAHREFSEKGHCRIYLCVKNADLSSDEMTLLRRFQEKVTSLGHFWTSYENIENLKPYLLRELIKAKRLLPSG